MGSGSEVVEIARLRAEIQAQAGVIRQQATLLAHTRQIFERSAALAKIGIWECNLHDDALCWTDQVYDLFDLPRGTTPDRNRTLRCYTKDSLEALTKVRSKAIAERKGFNLDAEITTAAGRRRWIRLTASVEHQGDAPVRLFGTKQDITEEKLLHDQTRFWAEFDGLTGLFNRRSFEARLAALGEWDGDALGFGALLLIDLDGFKRINDTFGHSLGDECLREAARRLKTICADADFLARIGGDEFAVLLSARLGLRQIEQVAERIVQTLRMPMRVGDRSFKVGASVGIERVGPCLPSELFAKADAALYAAKAAGRNTFRMSSPVNCSADV